MNHDRFRLERDKRKEDKDDIRNMMAINWQRDSGSIDVVAISAHWATGPLPSAAYCKLHFFFIGLLSSGNIWTR